MKKKKLLLLLAMKKIEKSTTVLLGFMSMKRYVRRWACTCQGIFDNSPFHCLCYLNDNGKTVLDTGESLEVYRKRIGCEHREARLSHVTLHIEQSIVENTADKLKIKIRGKRRDVFEQTSGRS